MNSDLNGREFKFQRPLENFDKLYQYKVKPEQYVEAFISGRFVLLLVQERGDSRLKVFDEWNQEVRNLEFGKDIIKPPRSLVSVSDLFRRGSSV